MATGHETQSPQVSGSIHRRCNCPGAPKETWYTGHHKPWGNMRIINEIQTTIQTVRKRLPHSIHFPENKTLRTEVHAIIRCWFSPKRSVPKSFEHDLCSFTVVPNDPWSRVWSHYPGNLQKSQTIEVSPNTPVSQPLRTETKAPPRQAIGLPKLAQHLSLSNLYIACSVLETAIWDGSEKFAEANLNSSSLK
jgi:hypothetical protein